MSKLSFLVCFRDTVGGSGPPYDSEALLTPYTQSIDQIPARAKKAGKKNPAWMAIYVTP
jgi:hypothetical protein